MKKALLATAALLMVAIGAVAVVGVGAQEGTPSPAAAGERPLDSYIAKLAAELGVSEDQLRTAMLNANLSLVDDAAAAGNVTAERAAEIKQRIQENDILLPPPPHHRGPGHHRGGPMIVGEAAGKVLNLEPGQLGDELRSGKSLAEVAQAHGMSVDDFKPALLAEVKTGLDAKVAEDKITQERADEAYQRLSDNIDDIINFKPGTDGGPFGPGGPRFGGEHGPGPFGEGGHEGMPDPSTIQ
ncbi:MAG: hypothetical protein Q7T33_04090 [Dehalococcoidia bacterium]|nr:hypothetical protein [Dehalococcoidia bacterium]